MVITANLIVFQVSRIPKRQMHNNVLEDFKMKGKTTPEPLCYFSDLPGQNPFYLQVCLELLFFFSLHIMSFTEYSIWGLQCS